MKFFSFHIGDWLPATIEMSGVEVGAFVRLLVWYYSHEQPLPLTWKELNRIAQVRTRADHLAVQTVIHRHFTLTPEGWRNAKADEVLKQYARGEPARTAKRVADADRQRVSRQRRDAKVAALISMGVQTPFNPTQSQLDDVLRAHQVTQVVTPDVTCDIASPETHDLRHAPAISHEPIGDAASAAPPAQAPAHEGAREAGGVVVVLRPLEPDRLASAVKALKAGGFPMALASMSDPRMLGALQAGCTDDALRLAATEAVTRGKSWGWLVAVVAGRTSDLIAGYGPPRAGSGSFRRDPDRVAGLTPTIAAKPPKPALPF